MSSSSAPTVRQAASGAVEPPWEGPTVQWRVCTDRLGPFGFLGSSTLRNRSSDGSTGNYGILDQRYSMRWVQANIAYAHHAPPPPRAAQPRANCVCLA